MHFLDADRVRRLLDFPSLVEALRESHRGLPPATTESLLADPVAGSENRFLSLAAWEGDGLIGTKLVTVFPANGRAPEDPPAVQACYLLFDGKQGRPLLMADGTMLTLRKTAADSALGTFFLARQDAERLLMVGAGALAPHVVAAHLSQRPSLRRVEIWNRTAARAESVAAGLRAEGIECRAVTDLEAAARQADIISCATMSTEPLIKGAWLKPGAHLDLMGGWQPSMREADDEAVRRAAVYVDQRPLCRRCGDLLGPVEAGVFDWSDIRADLYELCSGQVTGRRSDEEITLYKNIGGGHLDLYTARLLLQRSGLADVPR